MSHAGAGVEAGAGRAGPLGLEMALGLMFCLPFVSVPVYLEEWSYNVRKKGQDSALPLKLHLSTSQNGWERKFHYYNLDL